MSYKAFPHGYEHILRADPCVYCVLRKTRRPVHRGYTLDHIVAAVHGGTEHWGNMAPTCPRCNRVKGARSILEMLMNTNPRREVLRRQLGKRATSREQARFEIAAARLTPSRRVWDQRHGQEPTR